MLSCYFLLHAGAGTSSREPSIQLYHLRYLVVDGVAQHRIMGTQRMGWSGFDRFPALSHTTKPAIGKKEGYHSRTKCAILSCAHGELTERPKVLAC